MEKKPKNQKTICFAASKLHTQKPNSPKNQTPTVFLYQSSTLQIPAKITALLKPLLLLLLLLSSSSPFLLLLLLLLLLLIEQKCFFFKFMNKPPKKTCLAHTQSSKKWSKNGALGDLEQNWSRERPTHYPQVKEKKKELRRKEGRSWGLGGGREGSHTKTFPPNKIILIN